MGAVVLALPATSGALPASAQRLGTSGSGHHMHAAAAGTMVGPSGNRLEMVTPDASRYVPKVLRAPARARDRARQLLRGVNRFCANHTVAQLKAGWRPGTNHAHPTHYFNPATGASGLNPARPKAALVYDGKVGGVMFTGKPLPYLGPIPRAHMHDHAEMGGARGVEMVHVYCTSNLTVKSVREAYTPNRQLGVLADTLRLRLRIRPAVMDLNRRQLREVRAKVRGYVGEHPVQVQDGTSGGPDPQMQAMRTEIRRSLMDMNEAQLRSVWRLMRSY